MFSAVWPPQLSAATHRPFSPDYGCDKASGQGFNIGSIREFPVRHGSSRDKHGFVFPFAQRFACLRS